MVCVDLIYVRGVVGVYKDNLISKRKVIKMIKKLIDMLRILSLFYWGFMVNLLENYLV